MHSETPLPGGIIMEENRLLDKLSLFGLTRQEAAIYLCLYQHGGLTGYEVAKYTGISRSNVYSALSALADKGAAYLLEGSTNRYIAVPAGEFCANRIRNLEREKGWLMDNIPLERERETGYITITGSGNIRDKMINMIQSATQRIYLSAARSLIEEFSSALYPVIAGRLKLVLITDAKIRDEELERGCICYVGMPRGSNVRLIIDSAYALTGELTGSRKDTCLYTGQENFINLFKEALRNEIRLIELTQGKS